MYYDPVGEPEYSEIWEFPFTCSILNFANDKIRVYYKVPINEEGAESKFTNTLGPNIDPNWNKTTVFFRRSSGFQSQVRTEFDEDLNGLRNWYCLFHTKIGKNLTAFSNWNLTSDGTPFWWDSVEAGFWLAVSTTLLMRTLPYYIGKE